MKATNLKKAICAALAGLVIALTACGRSGYICDDRNVSVKYSVTAQNAVRARDESTEQCGVRARDESTAQDGIQPQDESIPQTVQNENGEVVSVYVSETGGEDGRMNDWNVYRDDGRYVFSFSDRFAQAEVFEITEEEYDDMMSLDYAGYIREYDEGTRDLIVDGVYFEVTITYENGEQVSAKAEGFYLSEKLYSLLVRYKEKNG